MQRLLASAWLAWLALGCGARSENDGAAPSGAEPVSIARDLARNDPRLARALVHGGLRARGAAASSPEAATDPFVQLPPTADGTLDFRAGTRSAPLARLRSLGASAAPLELIDGVAVYRGAVAGADALWLLRGNAVEQLLVVHEASTSLDFAWQLCHAPALVKQRLSPELGLLFSDASGTDRLRVPPGFAIDARGQRRELALLYAPESGDCGRVELHLDTRGLDAPLLVDPALEAVVWTDRTDPSLKPAGRFGHGLAYDPFRKKTVLFGGSVNSPPPFLGDTWEWDGAAWHDVTPGSGPEGRVYHDLAYSSALGGAVLIGGASGEDVSSVQNDVWVWDGAWTKLDPGGDTLPGVYGHSLAFDSARKAIVLYGGSGEDENRRVWELGAAGWSDRGEFTVSPGSVDMFSLTYDAADDATLAFGGSTPAGHSDNPFNARTDAAHLWNGKGWTSLDGERPSARSGMAGTYDSKRQRIVLFGGILDGEAGEFSDETWEYAGGRFERRDALRKPPARESAKLAYDAERDRVVLFGGFGSSDGDDTWTYAHFGNTCRDESDCDGEACVDGVCCQDKVCGTCEACSETTGTCQPVSAAEDADSGCSGKRSCNADGVCLASDAQACRADDECASGHCADGVCCDEICDGACQACAQPGHEGTCRFVEGDAAHGSCPGRGACATTCDGKHAECTAVPEGLDCGTTCSEAVVTIKTCDARGACRSTAPAECAEHLRCAGAQSCLTRCESGRDCRAGFTCQKGACVELTARCADEVTVEGPGGREDCGAYTCASGKCRTRCERAADCANGRVCNEQGQCLTPEAAVGPPPDDGSCGCRAARGAGHEGWLALGLLGLTRGARRRRA